MKKDYNELVTIGILAFNAKASILNAIEGALNQSWLNKEIIVIDDCSTDGTYEMIKSSKFNTNILLLRNARNLGTAYSRNQIILRSKGEYICFMDDDDISHPDRVSMQVASMKDFGYPKKKFIVSTCSILREYETGYSMKLDAMGCKGRLPVGNELADFILYFGRIKDVDYGFGIPTCSMMATKACFDKVGLFDSKLRRVEDLDILIRFSLSDVLFTSVKEYLLTQNSTTGSHKNPLNNLKAEIYLVNKHSRYLWQKGLFLYARLWPYLRYYHFTKNYFLMVVVLIPLFLLYPFRAIPHFFSTAMSRLKHERNIKNGYTL